MPGLCGRGGSGISGLGLGGVSGRTGFGLGSTLGLFGFEMFIAINLKILHLLFNSDGEISPSLSRYLKHDT